MLDENCEKALNIIINSCAGGYTVLDAGDFKKVTDAEKTLARLSAGGYVSLRYSGGDEYLLMPTEKGAEYFSKKNDGFVYKSVLRRECARYSFLGALFGAILGGAAVSIVTAVINFVSGINA